MKTKIIGVSGPNGAGKDEVGKLLAEHHGYLFVSVSQLLRDEATRRGQPLERKYLSAISAEWRRQHGLGVLVMQAVAQFEAAEPGRYKGVVMASLRNSAEADKIHELGGTMLWVDADPKVRFERIQARGRTEDNKTYEEFLAEEAAEMYARPDADEAELNAMAIKERADAVVMNETSLDELHDQLIEILDLPRA